MELQSIENDLVLNLCQWRETICHTFLNGYDPIRMQLIWAKNINSMKLTLLCSTKLTYAVV